jgi:hypothetical protein
MTRRLFVSVAGAAMVRAQTSQQRGREIIAKTIDALGGDAFRFLNTRTEAGRAYSFYREQITGLSIAHIYTKYLPPQPGGRLRMKQRQTFGKKQDDIVLLSDTAAWEITYRGARKQSDDRVQQFVNTTLHDIFYILRARLEEPEMVFESHGRDVVENQPVELIEVYDSENRNVTVWIHQDTFLPVRQRFRRMDPLINAQREEITHYTKYREAGEGVMWPHDVQRERDGDKIFELYSDRVTVGDSLPDSFFELPPGVTVLRK